MTSYFSAKTETTRSSSFMVTFISPSDREIGSEDAAWANSPEHSSDNFVSSTLANGCCQKSCVTDFSLQEISSAVARNSHYGQQCNDFCFHNLKNLKLIAEYSYRQKVLSFTSKNTKKMQVKKKTTNEF